MNTNTMLKLIVEVRDYIYVSLRKSKSIDIAKSELTILMTVLFGFYYLDLTIFVAILYSKFKFKVPPVFKESLIIQAIIGIILIAPFYFFIRLLLQKISTIPINETMSDSEYKKGGYKVAIVSIIGVISMFVVAWLSDQIIPNFR